MSSTAVLQKEFKAIRQSEQCSEFRIELVNDNMHHWSVTFPGSTFGDPLRADLKQFAQKYKKDEEIIIEMEFPRNYPLSPPFVHVIRPRFRFHTGHVTVNGSICVEVLTEGNGKDQWRPFISCESLIIMLQSLFEAGDGRVDFGSSHNPYPEYDYDPRYARDDFYRVARQHGWII